MIDACEHCYTTVKRFAFARLFDSRRRRRAERPSSRSDPGDIIYIHAPLPALPLLPYFFFFILLFVSQPLVIVVSLDGEHLMRRPILRIAARPFDAVPLHP